MKVAVICIILSGLLIFGCTIPYIDAPLIMRIKSASLTIVWDAPVINLPGSPNYVSSYRIYYSRYGTSDWRLLGETPAPENPSFTVPHSSVGDGRFVFAVSSLNTIGEESELHTSLDMSADPQSGWYIWWIRND